jgi:nucleoside-diphosphate-sugar epimerase
MEPTTVYGISKQTGERWCEYYHHQYGVDVRSVRYPGLISWTTEPGGGTTDYAVDIFYKAILQETFVCFLEKDTVLPMIYMEDAVRAALNLMDAPKESIKSRTSYNIAGMSFSPAELFDEIKKHYPNFKIVYQPDFRQAIASSWPKRIVDTEARNDWHWKPNFDTIGLVEDMILNLRKKELTEA